MPVVTGVGTVRTGGDDSSFTRSASVAISSLQRACADLLDALQPPVQRPVDLERLLDLDKKLAWQVFKLARAGNPLAEGLKAPSRASIRRLAAAARLHDAPPHVIKKLLESADSFEAFIQEHTGDRATFESMLSRISGEGLEKIDLAHKKAAFRAQSHIWGVRAKTHLASYIFNQSSQDPAMIDAASIHGLIGLRRFRFEASCLVSSARAADEDGKVRRQSGPIPLPGTIEAAPGVSLLREYCTEPLPEFQSTPAGDGWVDTEIISGEIGNKSATTCILGDLWRAPFPLYPDKHNRHQDSIVSIHTPCESLIFDVIVYEQVFGAINPGVKVYGKHRDMHPNMPRECDRLSIRESISYLGKGLHALHTPLIPKYTNMVSDAMDNLHWPKENFGVYRCLVRYPVMPSSVVVRFDLPQPD